MQLAEKTAEKMLQEPAQTAEPEPAPKPADPALTFARLARCVRQCIALEATISAGQTPTRRPTADPRRAPITRIVEEATRKNPERQRIRHEAENLLDEELLADPDQTTPIPHLFNTIVNELGLTFDPAHLSDQSIHSLCPGAPPLCPGEHQKPPLTLQESLQNLLAIATGTPEDQPAFPPIPDPPHIIPTPPPPPPPPPTPPPKPHPFLAAHQFHPGSIFDKYRSVNFSR